MPFQIAELPLLNGIIGICPMPGRSGAYEADLGALLRWSPDLVLTMTTAAELAARDAGSLPRDLALHQIAWLHLPVADFGTPRPETAALWPAASAGARQVLQAGGRVLAHCMGGCGRSGMALLRLMVDAGEDPDTALSRLRAARSCAVETAAQALWATGRP